MNRPGLGGSPAVGRWEPEPGNQQPPKRHHPAGDVAHRSTWQSPRDRRGLWWVGCRVYSADPWVSLPYLHPLLATLRLESLVGAADVHDAWSGRVVVGDDVLNACAVRRLESCPVAVA